MTVGDEVVELPCRPIEALELHRRLVEHLPEWALAIGVSDVPDLTITNVRSWTPMDGAGEPNCPYQDTETRAGANEWIAIDASCSSAHWNDNELAGLSVRLSLTLPSQPPWWISADCSSTNGLSAPITSLFLVAPKVTVAMRDAANDFLDSLTG